MRIFSRPTLLEEIRKAPFQLLVSVAASHLAGSLRRAWDSQTIWQEGEGGVQAFLAWDPSLTSCQIICAHQAWLVDFHDRWEEDPFLSWIGGRYLQLTYSLQDMRGWISNSDVGDLQQWCWGSPTVGDLQQ